MNYQTALILYIGLFYLICFELKHYVADGLLQTKYMRGKTLTGWAFILPLTAHVMCHIGFTSVILIMTDRLDLWWLLLVEFACHFTMDKIKSDPRLLGQFKGTEWNLHTIILDQTIHQLTYFYMIYMLIKT